MKAYGRDRRGALVQAGTRYGSKHSEQRIAERRAQRKSERQKGHHEQMLEVELVEHEDFYSFRGTR